MWESGSLKTPEVYCDYRGAIAAKEADRGREHRFEERPLEDIEEGTVDNPIDLEEERPSPMGLEQLTNAFYEEGEGTSGEGSK